MKLLKWTTVLIAQILLTQRVTNGRPLESSTESDLHGDLTNQSQEVVEQFPTKQSFQSFTDNAGDEESNLLTENEDWSATPNYESISGFEKETSNPDFPELPFNIAHPTSSLSTSNLPIAANSKEELEEDLELYYESSTIDSDFKDKTAEPSKLLKAPISKAGSEKEDTSVGVLVTESYLTDEDLSTLPNESFESPQNISESQFILDKSDIINNDTFPATYLQKSTTSFESSSTSKTFQTAHIKTATTPSFSTTTYNNQQLLNETDLEPDDNTNTQFTKSIAELTTATEYVTNEEDFSTVTISPTFEASTTIVRLQEFTRLFPTLSTDIISSVESDIEVPSTESPSLANSTNYDYNQQSSASNFPTSQISVVDEVAATATESIPISSTFDYEVIESTELYQPELNVSLELDTDDDNETISGSLSTKFRSLWNLISVEITNTVIIGGIAGGCAIIFLSLVMICCLYRKQDSGNLNSPPTESSNCSSNSSASSFPAAKSG